MLRIEGFKKYKTVTVDLDYVRGLANFSDNNQRVCYIQHADPAQDSEDGKNLKYDVLFKFIDNGKIGKFITNGSFYGESRIDLYSYMRENSSIKNVKFGDGIYIESKCIIPRSRIAAKFNRRINEESADHVLLPNPSFVNQCEIPMNDHLIFVDHKEKIVFDLRYSQSDRVKSEVKDALETFNSLDESERKLSNLFNLKNLFCGFYKYESPESRASKKAVFNSLMNSEFFYNGPMILVGSSNLWVQNVLDDNYDSFVIEDEIYPMTCDDDDIDEDTIENLLDLLNSPDAQSVSLGLGIVSEMNFDKYRNLILEILSRASADSIQYNKSSRNVAEKFMQSYLGINFNDKPYYDSKFFNFRSQFTELGDDEYDLFKELTSDSIFLRCAKLVSDYEAKKNI